MPLVHSDMGNLLLPGVKGIFFETYYAEGTTKYEQIATIVPSSTDTEKYGWLGSVPAMREFKDERKVMGLSENDYSLKNKTWESTLGIERAAIEDDQLGQVNLRIRGLAEEARRHKECLVFTTLNDAFTALAWDGNPFLYNRGTNQNNLGSTQLTSAGLKAGVATMMKYVDDRGNPFGVMPNVLAVGPDLWSTALELTQSPITVVNVGDGAIGSGALGATDYKNVITNFGLTVVCSPYLTGSGDWFLLDTTRAMRAIIFQNRLNPEITAQEANSENGFMRDLYLYGLRARYAAGYGAWWTCYGST